jgi:hypothetical protein
VRELLTRRQGLNALRAALDLGSDGPPDMLGEPELQQASAAARFRRECEQAQLERGELLAADALSRCMRWHVALQVAEAVLAGRIGAPVELEAALPVAVLAGQRRPELLRAFVLGALAEHYPIGRHPQATPSAAEASCAPATARSLANWRTWADAGAMRVSLAPLRATAPLGQLPPFVQVSLTLPAGRHVADQAWADRARRLLRTAKLRLYGGEPHPLYPTRVCLAGLPRDGAGGDAGDQTAGSAVICDLAAQERRGELRTSLQHSPLNDLERASGAARIGGRSRTLFLAHDRHHVFALRPCAPDLQTRCALDACASAAKTGALLARGRSWCAEHAERVSARAPHIAKAISTAAAEDGGAAPSAARQEASDLCQRAFYKYAHLEEHAFDGQAALRCLWGQLPLIVRYALAGIFWCPSRTAPLNDPACRIDTSPLV